MEKQEEKENSENQEEEENSEITSEEEETSEKTEVPSDLEEKNKRLYARAKKAEEDLKEMKKELDKFQKISKPEKTADETGKDEWKAKVNFLLKNKDYSEEEFEHISAVAQRKGISLEDAAESEKDYINYKREKVKKEKKIPEPSPASSVKTFTPQDIAKMSRGEHKKLIEERLKRELEGSGI